MAKILSSFLLIAVRVVRGELVFCPSTRSLREVDSDESVVHRWSMSTTLSVRLPEDLARWVEEKSLASGRSRGSLVKEALERIRFKEAKPFMHLAGSVKGPADLSTRKGFSKA